MSTPATSWAFRRLSMATAIAVYLLIVVGGVVRITGSGLGCPDWPLCYGQVIPPPDVTAFIEFAHRVVAAIGGALMIWLFVAAWRGYRDRREIIGPIATAVALLVVQVPLGAIVVATELEPLAVAFHLGMAMLIFAGVLLTAVAAFQPATGAPVVERARSYMRLLLVSLGVVFALLLTGALVVGTNSQLACPDWPLCHNGLLPPPNSSPQVAIQLIHRYTVVATSVVLAAVVLTTIRRAEQEKLLVRWAAVLAGLFVLQVIIGGVQVLLIIPMLWRGLHLAAASAVWGALVILTGLTALGQSAPAPHHAPSPPEGIMATPAGQ